MSEVCISFSCFWSSRADPVACPDDVAFAAMVGIVCDACRVVAVTGKMLCDKKAGMLADSRGNATREYVGRYRGLLAYKEM